MNRMRGSLALTILTLALFGLVFFLSGPQSPGNQTKPFLAPPPEEIEHFTFGFRESIADSLWLRWIQDSDICQTYAFAPELAESKRVSTEEHELTKEIRHKICDNSWGFKMLDAISRLAPKFKMIYIAGAPTLSILVEDYAGSTVIYNRGIEQYPDDWAILYRAAYHFQYDVHDMPRAAELLNRAGDNGAPNWVKSLASRLYTASGQLELGISTLESYKKTIDPEKTDAIKKVEERIAELRGKLQP